MERVFREFAKKIICGDEWNAVRLTKLLSEKWESFYSKLGAKRSNVDKLLDKKWQSFLLTNFR